MARFTEEQLTQILKEFCNLDDRMRSLSHKLFVEMLEKMARTDSLNSLEKWIRLWKSCRLDIKKTFHKYGLVRSGDKKDVHSFCNLYLDDKSIAKELKQAPRHVQDRIIGAMGNKRVKIIVSHPSKGFAERIAHRIARGLEQQKEE